MNKLKTISIKGKDYVEVHERLKHFRKYFNRYTLESKVLDKTDTTILIKAIIKDEEGRTIATGLAEESKGSTFINKTSYVENCETSAWGRALGNFGIGLDTSVASANEVANAIAQQEAPQTTTVYDLNIGDENWDKVLSYVVANKNLGIAKLVSNLQKKYKIKANVKKEISNVIKT
jgi:hypothetical protein|tara:strand:- start:1474 stop:2001 length:528 start_codon:yes stop_codon:yes gene_type:complete